MKDQIEQFEIEHVTMVIDNNFNTIRIVNTITGKVIPYHYEDSIPQEEITRLKTTIENILEIKSGSPPQRTAYLK